MAEEIITSPEESLSMDAPIVESPVDVQEDVVDVEPTPSKGLQNLQKLHSLLIQNDVYSKITPERFDDFVEKYRDPIKMKKLHSLLVENDVYSKIMPADINEAADKYGFGGLGKLSAVPSPSAIGGSATKGGGTEQQSSSQKEIDDWAKEYDRKNLEQTKNALAGKGKFPNDISYESMVEMRKQLPGNMDPDIIEISQLFQGRTLEEAKERLNNPTQQYPLQPRKPSEVEQSVMGYGLPKTIEIGGGKANVEEELRLPTEGEFGAIEKMPLTKEAKLEEAVRLGTPPVERVTKDITQNKINLLTSEKELKKLEEELADYKQQSDSYLAIYENETLSPEERNQAGQEYNKVNQEAAPLSERYNELANNYNGYIANEKVLFGDLDKAEKMRQKGLEKEYSHLLNLTQSVGRDIVKTVTGMVRMGATIQDLIPNFGLITEEQEEAGKKALFDGLDATNKFAEQLITQETPENYKKMFEGDFSLGKLAYITTNAVSSTAPTVAAGLLTGGLGSVAAGAGLGFEESKSIMKDAGLSDEQSDWAALGLAIPIGLLEKYGADDVVRLLNGSGIRKQVATELAKKVAGKTLSREAIFLEAKKTFGEVIKSKTAKILKEGRNESLTEAAQGELQELTKQIVQEFTGVDKDENMSTADYLQQQFMQRAEEAAGGFLGGTSMQGAGVAFNAALNKQEFSPSAYTKAMEFADPAKFEQFKNDLMSEVQSGVLTEEQANNAITNVQAIQETNALIPKSVQDLDLRTDAVNLIIEKNDLLQEIEGKDPDLTISENTRLADIKKALNDIALGNKPGVEEQQMEEAPVAEQALAAEEPITSTQEESMASIGQAGEPVEPKAPKKIKTIAEIVEEQKQKKAVEERQQAARDLFAAQKAKGEQIRLQKEADAKDAIEAQRKQRDEEVKQIEAIRPDLTSSDVLMADLPASIETVVDRMDANIPTDITAVNEAIDALDKKFDELEKYKNDPNRTHTTAQIDEVIDLLDSTKKELQYYQEAITDYEGSIENRTTAEGITEAKTAQASTQAEAEQATEVESFPAQEGAASEQEKEFKAHPELEQVYRDLHAAVNKNLDPKTLDAVKRNPTLVMVEKALRELERKGVIKIEC